MTATRRVTTLLFAVVAGLLCSLLISRRMWLGEPLFAPLSVLGESHGLGTALNGVVFLALVLLLLPVPFVPRLRRRLIFAWCGLALARGVWDQVLWQPWLLQYAFMLLTLAFVAWDRQKDDVRDRALDVLRFVVVCVYLWSGASKFHHRFLDGQNVLFVQPFVDLFDLENRYLVTVPVATLETLAALALLFPRTRRAGVVGLVAMHAGILVLLGPWWHDHNPVVWPWNVMMVVTLFVLFWSDRARPLQLVDPRRSVLHLAAVVVFVACPLLSYVDAWPTYLSFRLYSNRHVQGGIMMEARGLEFLPDDARPFVLETPGFQGFTHILDLAAWGEHRLAAFPTPREEVYKLIAARYVRTTGTNVPVMLVIFGVPDWRTGKSSLTGMRITPPRPR